MTGRIKQEDARFYHLPCLILLTVIESNKYIRGGAK